MQVAQFCSALPYLRTDHGLPSEQGCWLAEAVTTLRTGYPDSARYLAELPLMVQVLLLQAQTHLHRFFEAGIDKEGFEAMISDAARQQLPIITAAVEQNVKVRFPKVPIIAAVAVHCFWATTSSSVTRYAEIWGLNAPGLAILFSCWLAHHHEETGHLWHALWTSFGYQDLLYLGKYRRGEEYLCLSPAACQKLGHSWLGGQLAGDHKDVSTW